MRHAEAGCNEASHAEMTTRLSTSRTYSSKKMRQLRQIQYDISSLRRGKLWEGVIKRIARYAVKLSCSGTAHYAIVTLCVRLHFPFCMDKRGGGRGVGETGVGGKDTNHSSTRSTNS